MLRSPLRAALRPRVALLLPLALLVLRSAPADATVVRAFSLRDLAREAYLVALVEVGDLHALRVGPEGFIHTDATLEILETWKAWPALGRAPGSKPLVLRQIGGRLGGHEQFVAGTAPVRKGDRLVIFARVIDGRAYLVGLGQGAYRVLRQGRRRVVVRATAGRRGSGAAVPPGARPLSSFKAEVLRLVEEARRSGEARP